MGGGSVLILFYVESESPAGLRAVFDLLEEMSIDPGVIPESLALQVQQELKLAGITVNVVGASFTAPVEGEKEIEVIPDVEFPYITVLVASGGGLAGTFLLYVAGRCMYKRRQNKYKKLEKRASAAQAYELSEQMHAWTQTPGGWHREGASGSPPPSEGVPMFGSYPAQDMKVHPVQDVEQGG
jgi:hypothetical protein